MIGLIDCNNFYVSCECVFNPRLVGQRVAVLTNNDGCVVSRSPEFKKLNIPVGTPYFKIKDLEKPLGLIFISSNYELYADMSNRVMSVLRQFTPQVEQYSIDEAFIHLLCLHADARQARQRNREKADEDWRFRHAEKCARYSAGDTCG